MLHQNSGNRPKEKKVKELGNRAHHRREAKEIPRMMVKQNPRMITMYSNQPAQIGGVGQKRFPQEDKTDR